MNKVPGFLFIKIRVLILFAFLFCTPVYAQHTIDPEYKIKAVFLFNFTRFVDWPAQSFASSNSPFIIGIVGNDPFGNYIEEVVSGEEINGHKILILRFENLSNVHHCQILFINTADDDRIKEILSISKGKNILTVGETENFVKLGGVVQFYKEDEKIRLEINIASARESHLNFSSKLLGVAEIY